MIIFLKITKYVFNTFLFLLLIFTLTALLFLYKPSFFLSNVENYISNSLESYSSDLNVNIDIIEGNFFSGFFIREMQVYDNKSIDILVKEMFISPNLEKIVYGKLVFDSIKVDDIKIKVSKQLEWQSKNNSLSSLLIPQIIINNILISNGCIQISNQETLFSGLMNAKIGGMSSEIGFLGLNLYYNDKMYYLDKGVVQLSESNMLINSFSLNDSEGKTLNVAAGFDIKPFVLNQFDISFENIRFSLTDDMFISGLNLISLNDRDYQLRAVIKNKNKVQNIDISGLYNNKGLSFQMNEKSLFNNLISFFGSYDFVENSGDFQFKIKHKNLFDLNGNLLFSIDKDLNINIYPLLDMSNYKDVYFYSNNRLGKLIYDGKNISGSSLSFKTSDKIDFYIKNFLFESIEKFSLDGYIENNNLLDIQQIANNIIDIKFKNQLHINNSWISYDYSKNKSKYSLKVSGVSEEVLYQDYLFRNINYDLSYSGVLDAANLNIDSFEFNSYSFDSLRVKYKGSQLSINSYNINSGEYLDFQSSIDKNNVSIDYLKAKINNVSISCDSLLFNKRNNEYLASNVKAYLDKGWVAGDIRFKNFNDYSIRLNTNQLDINKIDKLIFLNNRYGGNLNGDLYFSKIKGKPLIIVDVLVDSLRFDDFIYTNAVFNGSLKDNVVLINRFNNSNNTSSFNMSGFIETRSANILQLSKYDKIELRGDIVNLNISLLNRYIPWSINLGGNMNASILINGAVGNPKFEIIPAIINPKFDKIEGSELIGKIFYQNNRLYISNMNLKTKFGKYDLEGSLPFNFGYFDYKDISEKSVYIDMKGSSSSFEMLTPYFPFIKNLTGSFDYSLNIYGTYNNLIRDGELNVKGAKMNILQLDNSIDRINAHAFINNNRLVINSFKAELSEDEYSKNLISDIRSSMKNVFSDNSILKKIELSGSINLESFFNPDFSLILNGYNNYFSSSYGQFEGFASSSLSITGRDTVLISGEFKPEFNQFTLFNVENRRGDESEIIITDSKFIAYDIYMPFSNGIKVKSDNLNLFVEGEMNLSSFSNDKVSISGEANIIDGSFFYNGNEFYNTQGTILIDPIIKNPYIELHSMTDIYDDNINVSFIGYSDNPNLILESSISDYSQSDILQLLTFQDKNLNKSISQPFTNILSNYLESQLEKNITLYTDLDEFRVQHSGSLMQGFSDSDINVLLGKRISNRLYLNTKINLNDNNLNEYEMSYRLNNNTSIVAKVDDNKYWKLNYRFKYKY